MLVRYKVGSKFYGVGKVRHVARDPEIGCWFYGFSFNIGIHGNYVHDEEIEKKKSLQ